MKYDKQSDNQSLVAGAKDALAKFKYETANEISLSVPQGDYWGNLSSRDCGRIGGNMVKKMIQIAEQQLQQSQTMR